MGNQLVKEDELAFILDPKTKKPVILGKGASGVVKLATFNDKKVAVKYYRDFEHDEEMAKEAKVRKEEKLGNEDAEQTEEEEEENEEEEERRRSGWKKRR
jgi:predicted Ser/Thr protein kinase